MELAAEKQRLIRAVYVPLLLLAVVWASKGIELITGVSFGTWGIYPKSLQGLTGIILAPFIHADIHHLFGNTVPLFVLTTAVFYFYRPMAFKLLAMIWIVTGLCVWIGGRNAYHIGASGIIYGEASFLFFSGVLRQNVKLAALSLLVIFLYGGMVWGIFPFFPEISWESHLFGGLSGLIFALIYRHDGTPSAKIPDDDDEEIPFDWQETSEETDETQNTPYSPTDASRSI